MIQVREIAKMEYPVLEDFLYYRKLPIILTYTHKYKPITP
jgi:hypothetical protein